MVMKKLTIGIAAFLLAAAAAGCSNGGTEKEETPAADTPAATEAPAAEAEDAALEQKKAVIAVAIAEDKVNAVFHHDALEDGTPILNPTLGTEEAAKDLLLGYFDAAVVDRMIAHYISAPATDKGLVVNADPFITSSLIGAKPEDVTMEGSKADGFTITTKDNVKYTVTWNEENGRYIVANIE